jgi:hypothetical protein
MVSFHKGPMPLLLPTTYEHGNEPSGSLRGGEFLDQLSICELPKKKCDVW